LGLPALPLEKQTALPHYSSSIQRLTKAGWPAALVRRSARASPIEPSWILEGNPEARSRPLSTGADGAAGSIVLESAGMPPKRYGVGDVIFFRDGVHAKWHVERYVKRVAFLRQTSPIGFGFAIRAVNKLKRTFFAPSSVAPRATTFIELLPKGGP
jgi:uncharacterized protein